MCKHIVIKRYYLPCLTCLCGELYVLLLLISFLFEMISQRPIISRTTLTVVTKFLPNGRSMIRDEWLDLLAWMPMALSELTLAVWNHSNIHKLGNIAHFNYNLFSHKSQITRALWFQLYCEYWKTYQGHSLVGNHVLHSKAGSISETVQDWDVVTTGHKQKVICNPSNSNYNNLKCTCIWRWLPLKMGFFVYLATVDKISTNKAHWQSLCTSRAFC